ncbi:hypothetical protein [Acinetobacter pseudolwoffii]|uniref:hypothetical protein n=1 Tax=Acinetobacter pseudolwoffii TaxID=2053287 RepID=UPI000C23D071|nr:hypothetical protein [Acinetobacter pseudolwoffii]PJI34329.1 hypothetical protein CU318_12355 [Acinetobacter pseudolwoffii]
MSGIATAVVVGSVATGVMSSKAQKKAANAAAGAQMEASEMGVEEQRRQFDAVQKLLKPYADAGLSGLSGQQDLIGINGMSAQQAAIGNINNSAEMQTYLQQGENAILQNASATGGLRGGNTQAALAQFRPQLLNQLINQRYQNLAGMTSLGQNAAAGTGNAGMQAASNISNLYQQSGAAQAGAALAHGQANANMWNSVGSTIGTLGGMKLTGMF